MVGKAADSFSYLARRVRKTVTHGYGLAASSRRLMPGRGFAGAAAGGEARRRGEQCLAFGCAAFGCALAQRR